MVDKSNLIRLVDQLDVVHTYVVRLVIIRLIN